MSATAPLLDGISIEITARDAATLPTAASSLPAGTRVHVTHLGTEEPAARVEAAGAARSLGLVPVPHVAARRVPSEAALRQHLAALTMRDAHRRMFIIGGDPATPAGPYADAEALIRGDVLADHHVEEVGFAAYPEGHPAIASDVLWASLLRKQDAVREAGMAGLVATQMSFDADAVLAWIAEARARGLELPIRVGVPGPASVARLVGFARRCGVSATASIAKKYGFSLTSLIGSAGPERLVGDLVHGLSPAVHGDVSLHLYTFGNLEASVDWIARAEALPA
ncbi:methylenetetrahydrofolate reductase [Demequina sp. SYSU T00039]|uniref:Methylenetetrahydrofolate reductase n=1 Tax=Demequina lignilytica TaxID=3051663 RepID=A0AAW7M130_9MICO|nr:MULTISPECIES: methylenetetrahydrofolate reductase [unclassified Demequina]MDN4477605.1 methylenetetrahydrofolate reductase [Demequina sp. SYSU T00039-1]MDN4488044.1 methylenetetrahydrofolate reductase [Demequina sp. SYSU T00039]MDN4490484.1 methylenetetrahydrofolate reductase [Demequina sp. SYSU T00068]